MKKGTVIKSTGSWYKVQDEEGNLIDCRIKGKVRTFGIKSTNPVAVGDEVEFEPEGDNGLIKDILPRDNYIVRRSVNLSKRSHILAANVDHVYLLVTISSPQTQLGFIDRFLVTAEAYHIPATILFNKVDLYSKEELEKMEELLDVYQTVGYRCFAICAKRPESVEFLKEEIKGKKVMLGGHSGVGKSTLANALDANLELKTAEISETHESGQHTTTFAEMHPLASGGYLIDTPGIRAFGLIDFDKKELSHYFLEMRDRLGDCKFNDCQHLDEPKCAIKDALDAGEIDINRYLNYVQIMETDDDDPYRKDIYK